MTRSVQHRLKIDAPFIFCDTCKGTGNYMYGCGEYHELCSKCDGTGRIYFQFEPGFVTRFREWWKKLPLYKRIGYWGCLGIFAAFCLIIAGYWIWP